MPMVTAEADMNDLTVITLVAWLLAIGGAGMGALVVHLIDRLR